MKLVLESHTYTKGQNLNIVCIVLWLYTWIEDLPWYHVVGVWGNYGERSCMVHSSIIHRAVHVVTPLTFAPAQHGKAE